MSWHDMVRLGRAVSWQAAVGAVVLLGAPLVLVGLDRMASHVLVRQFSMSAAQVLVDRCRLSSCCNADLSRAAPGQTDEA
jgi:hypothetical protein